MSAAITTRALRKVYPAPPGPRRAGAGGWAPPPGASVPQVQWQGAGAPREIVALAGLDLEIQQGEFFGLLGPNGAGKTTTIGILTTRVAATGGTASVAGADVVRQPVEVRRRIGVVPQRPNPDRGLNVVENLLFHSAYFGIPKAVATEKAMALLG